MKLYSLIYFFFIIYNTSAQHLDGSQATYQTLKSKLQNSKMEENDRSIALNFYKIGKLYQEAELYGESLKNYRSGLNYLKDTSDSLVINIMNSIAEVEISKKNYDRAEEILKKAKDLATAKSYTMQIGRTTSLFGIISEKRGNYKSALNYQHESLNLFKKMDNKEEIGQVLDHIGSIHEDREEYEQAFKYFKDSYEILRKTSSAKALNALNNIGDIYRKTDQLELSVETTKQVLERATQLKNSHQIESAHKDLSKTYSLLGQYKKSLEHLNIFLEKREANFYSQNFNQQNLLQAVFDSKQKENEIALLRQENHINRARQNLSLVIVIFILIMGSSLYYFNSKKRRAKFELQSYQKRLLEAELQNKSIIEKKLSDEIIHKTASLSKYSLNIAHKNELIADVASKLENISQRPKMDPHLKLKSLSRELHSSLQKDEEWEEFLNYFKEIHPDFISKLMINSEQKLSPTEIRLAMLLRLNLSSKEIASILRITPDSVRVARYRLRRKLIIKKKQDLSSFLREF